MKSQFPVVNYALLSLLQVVGGNGGNLLTLAFRTNRRPRARDRPAEGPVGPQEIAGAK